MKDGIFRKLLLTYILILVLIIAIISVSLSQFFRLYFFEDKQKELISLGSQVETNLFLYHRGDIGREELIRLIDNVGHAANARVIVVESSEPKLLERDIGSEFYDLVKKVIEGDVVVKRQQYASELDTYVVAVGLPHQNAEGNKGAILLFSPVYEVSEALSHIYRVIWLASLIALIVGLLLVWNYSRKISRPIIELSHMAGQIAEGRNVPDFNHQAGGEVGQLIRSFNLMKNQLAKTEKLRHEFIAGVSHELRTPLTSVRGFIQGILDGIVKPEDQRKYIKLAFRETGRLTRMTNDLLELTKLEAGVIELEKREVVMREILEDSISLARKGEGARDIPIEVQIYPSDLSIEADPDRLKQVFINILNNALKYTPEDGFVKVTVCVEDNNIKIKILDTGIGIPQEELPFIFEKFHRVDKARSADVRGTGLGLSIAKNIIEMHGGTISADSKIGGGTVFLVMLPAK